MSPDASRPSVRWSAGALLVACALFPLACERPSPPRPAPSSDPSDPGVTLSRRELKGGLVVTDLRDGDGAECPQGATVEVNFSAALEDGKVFDSSEQRRRPLILPLSRPTTIEGLREGIPGMRVGGTRRIEIPWPLAYGEDGRDPVPPMNDLTFEITLLRIIEDAGKPQ